MSLNLFGLVIALISHHCHPPSFVQLKTTAYCKQVCKYKKLIGTYCQIVYFVVFLFLIVLILLLPPLDACPKRNSSVGCFRGRVLRDRLLTSDRHGDPLLWSEELEAHH